MSRLMCTQSYLSNLTTHTAEKKPPVEPRPMTLSEDHSRERASPVLVVSGKIASLVKSIYPASAKVAGVHGTIIKHNWLIAKARPR